MLQIFDLESSAKYICFSCSNSLDVAFGFKKKCEESMAASAQKTAEIQSRVFKGLSCTQCNEYFEDEESLAQHCVEHPISVSSDEESNMDRDEESSTDSDEKLTPDHNKKKMYFKIPTPNSKMSKNQKLNVGLLVCRYCNREFKNKAGLIVHHKWHEIKKDQMKCTKCHLVFLHKKSFEEHYDQAHKELDKKK